MLETDGRIYKATIFRKTSTIFVQDVTEEERLKQYILSKEPAVISIMRKFSNEAKLDEVQKLKLNLEIDEYVEE